MKKVTFVTFCPLNEVLYFWYDIVNSKTMYKRRRNQWENLLHFQLN